MPNSDAHSAEHLTSTGSSVGAPEAPPAFTHPQSDIRHLLLYGVVLFSGFAGLGYQMAWTRMLSVSLGHEFTAVLAVVAAFFVGLSLGGLLFNKALRNTQAPLHWYVVLEIVIGLWALILMIVLPSYNQLSALLIGTDPKPLWHWSVAFIASLLVLLPATLAMGATLPAAHRVAESLANARHGIAGLYSVNTGGALLGTLVATYGLLPALGLSHTLILFACINFVIAALLWFCIPRKNSVLNTDSILNSNDAPSSPPTSNTLSSIRGSANRSLFAVLFFTGLLGLGYEILVIRVLSQILEGTVYSFAAVLSIYLLGTSLGAAFYSRHRSTLNNSTLNNETERQITERLIAAVSFFCLLGTALLWATDSIYQHVFQSFGPGNLAAMFAELCVAVVVFLLPTIAMGALFSHLAQRAANPHGLGAALGINTLGSAFAPLLFGVLLLPNLGALETLVILAISYTLVPWLLGADVSWLRFKIPLLTCAIALVLVPGPLRFVSAPQGSELLTYEEGVLAAVAVVEEPDGSRHLKVNNRFTMGGTASRFSDHRQTHLPLLWQGGDAQRALYLGLGTGITFQAAQYYPKLKATGVELIPEMLPFMRHFGVDVKGNHWPMPPKVIAADARRFILADNAQYDVIIAEVFHPSRDGAGSLYTVEHFRAVRERLSPQGLFCQWLPLFQLDLDTLRLITRSYLEVFPNAQMHLAHFSLRQPLLCLLGGNGLKGFEENWLLKRVHDRSLQQQLVKTRLNSDFALFGGYLGGPQALDLFAQGVPLNTDDHPHVIFDAPSFVYGNPESAAERLLELVTLLAPQRGTLLNHASILNLTSKSNASVKDVLTNESSLNNPSTRLTFAQRLENYWRARDAFLAAGVGVVPSSDIRSMVTQTSGKLLAAVRLSNDFLPAYDPLLQMAQSVYAVDPTMAHNLLIALDQANPTLPDARRLYRKMFGPFKGKRR
ncbi:MAG: hypothetical protein MI976_22630 [Pseudomonadales bacterium]|nr:hypothetical protein [Pseudomonadales bacterium]